MLKKEINFLKELTIIKFKALNQYKINIYMPLLGNSVYMIMTFFSFFALKQNLPGVFYWNLQQFLFFAIVLEIFVFLAFSWFRKLSRELILGNFNIYLTKPINTMYNYALSALDFMIIPMTMLYIFYFIIYLIYYHSSLNLLRLIITLIFCAFGSILFISTAATLDFVAFFLKRNKFLIKTYAMTSEILAKYPASFFRGSIVELFSYLIAVTYLSSYATDFYFNYINYNELLKLFIIMLTLTIIFLTIASLFWEYGLKKYEAYG